MKVNLTVGDRIILPTILPSKGSYEDLIVQGDIMDKVRMTQEETEKFGIKQIRDQIAWTDVESEFEYEFSELEEGIIIRTLSEMSTRKELSQNHIGLYKKFVSKTSEKQKEKKK